MTQVRSSFSIVDLEAGARIGEVMDSGLIFWRIQETDDDHLWIIPFRESLKPLYTNLGTHVEEHPPNIWSPRSIGTVKEYLHCWETTSPMQSLRQMGFSRHSGQYAVMNNLSSAQLLFCRRQMVLSTTTTEDGQHQRPNLEPITISMNRSLFS